MGSLATNPRATGLKSSGPHRSTNSRGRINSSSRKVSSRFKNTTATIDLNNNRRGRINKPEPSNRGRQTTRGLLEARTTAWGEVRTSKKRLKRPPSRRRLQQVRAADIARVLINMNCQLVQLSWLEQHKIGSEWYGRVVIAINVSVLLTLLKTAQSMSSGVTSVVRTTTTRCYTWDEQLFDYYPHMKRDLSAAL